MNETLVWIASAFGLIALLGVFYRMKEGFGPFNLRMVGIVVVATFSTLYGIG